MIQCKGTPAAQKTRTVTAPSRFPAKLTKTMRKAMNSMTVRNPNQAKIDHGMAKIAGLLARAI